MPPRTVPGVAVPGSTVPVDRVTTRPWVTPCQIAGAAPIKGRRSEPVAIAPCFYPMASAVIRAIDPITGEAFTRTTARTYYAAIVATNPASGAVETLTWCGRPDLALSKLDRAVRGTLDHWRGPRPDARLAIVETVLGEAPAVKPARPRTLAQLTAHPWVEAINDDRDTGDNLHVYLRPGFVWAGTTSAVIEPTVREACQAFREVAWDPAAWGEACGASPAEVAALTGEAAPAPAAPAPRPVLPGEATPPPAPSHGEAAPSLPELRAILAMHAARLLTHSAAPYGLAITVADLATGKRRPEPIAAGWRQDHPDDDRVTVTDHLGRPLFTLPDTFTPIHAMACAKAAGWILSADCLDAAKRWTDELQQQPDPAGVAVAREAWEGRA